MSRFLFVSEAYPSGLMGNSVRTRNFIEYLLKHGHLVDVCCLEFESQVTKKIRHEKCHIFSVIREREESTIRGKIVKTIRLLLSFSPFFINQLYDKQIAMMIKKLCQAKDYDEIFLDGFSQLQYSQKIHNKLIYIEDEDMTDLMWQRFKQERKILQKIFLLYEYLTCLLYEKRYFPKVDQIWAVSRYTLNRLKYLSDAKIFVMPTIISPQKNVFSSDSRNIVFTGTLNWPENINGVKWFAVTCWDDIKKRYPQTKLFVIGQEASEEIKGFFSQYKDIVLAGYVPDLASTYKKCALAIAPIFINTGIKIKVLTYLRYGIPTVATTLATKGMISQDGVICSNKRNFSKKVCDLLGNQQKRSKLSQLALKNIKQNHSDIALSHFLNRMLPIK